MKMLVATNLPWRTDVSVGNTLSNLLDGLEDELQITQVFFREGTPSNAFADRCFKIPERELAKSIVTRRPVGSEILLKGSSAEGSPDEALSLAYNRARQLRWDSLLLAQDLIGALGVWRSEELYRFVESFEPDLLFGALGRVPVVNDLLSDLSDRYSLPLFVYAWDDHYTVDRSRKSPFYRARVALEREGISRCAKRAQLIYSITPELGQLYEQAFSKEYRVLRKGYRFVERPRYASAGDEIRMLYAGNIGAERWRVLAALVDAIGQRGGLPIRLDVYTHSPVSEEMRAALSRGKSYLHPGVPASELPSLFEQSDVLVHVEATEPRERERCRYSFSTKIVDYLHAARCVLSLGGPTTATDYLRDNDAALVVNDLADIPTAIRGISENRGLIEEYAEKAWACGKRNHEIEDVQTMLMRDFRRAIGACR